MLNFFKKNFNDWIWKGNDTEARSETSLAITSPFYYIFVVLINATKLPAKLFQENYQWLDFSPESLSLEPKF